MYIIDRGKLCNPVRDKFYNEYSIMQLTRFTDYGLRCLMYLAARPDDLSSVKEISEYYKISRNHLVKIVHRLSQLGYIETSKGKGGGIRLAEGA